MSEILGDIKDLQPNVLQNLKKALAELNQQGIDYRLTSGYRSPEEQARLYHEWQEGVPGIYHPALPGKSRHQQGTAIDLEFAPGETPQGRQIMAQYGFQFTGGRTDPVHYDFTGTAPQGKGDPQEDDPTQVDNDPSHLDPRFNDRLQKVLAHMTDVTGVQWGINEGLRSQARQTYLYAQGRTRPGPKITWLQTPIYHGSGFAADIWPVGFKGTPPMAWWEEARNFGATLGLTNPAWGKGDHDHLQWSDGLKQFGPVQQTSQGTSQQPSQGTNSGTIADAFLSSSGSQPAQPSNQGQGGGGSVADAFLGGQSVASGGSSPNGSFSYKGKSLSDLENQAVQKASQYGIDPKMFLGVIRTESGFNPQAVNPKSGAAGLGQFMPGTWKQYGGGADVFDPSANLDGAAHYLSDLLAKNNGDWNKALAGYYGKMSPTYIGTVRSYASQYTPGSQTPPPTSQPGQGSSSGGMVADAFLGSSSS